MYEHNVSQRVLRSSEKFLLEIYSIFWIQLKSVNDSDIYWKWHKTTNYFKRKRIANKHQSTKATRDNHLYFQSNEHPNKLIELQMRVSLQTINWITWAVFFIFKYHGKKSRHSIFMCQSDANIHIETHTHIDTCQVSLFNAILNMPFIFICVTLYVYTIHGMHLVIFVDKYSRRKYCVCVCHTDIFRKRWNTTTKTKMKSTYIHIWILMYTYIYILFQSQWMDTCIGDSIIKHYK